MKKILYILLFLCMCGKIDAQSVVKEGAEYECVCVVYIVPSARGTNDTYGYILTPFHDDDEPLRICNPDGTPVTFQNTKSLLLYMAKRGWSFIWTTQFEHWEFNRLIRSDVTACIIKKMVTDDSEILQDLFLTSIRK